MVRRDTFSSCAAWSIETLRPNRGSTTGDSGFGLTVDTVTTSTRPYGRVGARSAVAASRSRNVLIREHLPIFVAAARDRVGRAHEDEGLARRRFVWVVSQ